MSILITKLDKEGFVLSVNSKVAIVCKDNSILTGVNFSSEELKAVKNYMKK